MLLPNNGSIVSEVRRLTSTEARVENEAASLRASLRATKEPRDTTRYHEPQRRKYDHPADLAQFNAEAEEHLGLSQCSASCLCCSFS